MPQRKRKGRVGNRLSSVRGSRSNRDTDDGEAKCEVCGYGNHKTEECVVLNNSTLISDNRVPQKAFLTLPHSLTCDTLSDGLYSVVTKFNLVKGIQFGPMDAPRTSIFNPACKYMLKIFKGRNDSSFLDTTDESLCNWMTLVPFSKDGSGRNCICYQLKQEIYFSLVEDIPAGERLIVSYSEGYKSLMEDSTKQVSKEGQSSATLSSGPSRSTRGQKKKDNAAAASSKLKLSLDHDYIQSKAMRRNKSPKKTKEAEVEVFHEESIFTEADILKDGQMEGESNTISIEVEISMEKTGTISQSSESDLPRKKKKGSSSSESYICELCGKIYYRWSSLKTHRQTHGPRKYPCKLCNKSFHRRELLVAHSFVHKEAEFECDKCNKKFKSKKSLDIHADLHRNIKRFSCHECGRVIPFVHVPKSQKFAQNGNLQQHLRIHLPTEDKGFPCDHCGKSFASKEYRHTHMQAHLHGKQHVCDLCGKSFMKFHMLNQHKKTAHSDLRWACEFCNLVVRQKHSLFRHLKKRHDESMLKWSQPGYLDSRTTICDDTTGPPTNHFTSGNEEVKLGIDERLEPRDDRDDLTSISRKSRGHIAKVIMDPVVEEVETEELGFTRENVILPSSESNVMILRVDDGHGGETCEILFLANEVNVETASVVDEDELVEVVREVELE